MTLFRKLPSRHRQWSQRPRDHELALMTTRLDRLLLLLANGPNTSVRQTAAKQLGSLAAQRVSHGSHSEHWRGVDGEWSEVIGLLRKILPYLRSNSWDTRIAASQAIEAICDAVGVWDPTTIIPDIPAEPADTTCSLGDFDLNAILENGRLLVAASTNESTPAASKASAVATNGANGSKEDNDGVSEHDGAIDGDDAGLSARERAVLKRKRKAQGKQGGRVVKMKMTENTTKSLTDSEKEHTPPPVEASSVNSRSETTANVRTVAPSLLNDSEWQPAYGEWPFSKISDSLATDLLDARWEIRHGAALGLRELFRHQYVGAVTCRPKWTKSLIVRILTVLALDRFVDFVGDHAAVPCRDTAAQAVALLLRGASAELVRKTGLALLQLIHQRDTKKYAWQVRHSGLLGMQYLMGIRADVVCVKHEGDAATFALNSVLESALLGLRDQDDDVRAAAASALLPLVDELQALPLERQKVVVDTIWDCLQESVDDLASSVALVMHLLSRLISVPAILDSLSQNTVQPLASRVPLLFPFFRHAVSAVRLSVVKALCIFLTSSVGRPPWLEANAMRLLYQNLLLEEKPDIREHSSRAWNLAVGQLDDKDLVDLTNSSLVGWVALASSPVGVPMDKGLLWRPASAISAHDVDKPVIGQDLAIVSFDHIIAGRLAAISALAYLLYCRPASHQEGDVQTLLLPGLAASAMQQRFVAAGMIAEWAAHCDRSAPLQGAASALFEILDSQPPSSYDETSSKMQQLFDDSHKLATSLGQQAVSSLPSRGTFRVTYAKTLVGPTYETLAPLIAHRTPLAAVAAERRSRVLADIVSFEIDKEQADTRLLATVARAIVMVAAAPPKLTPLIRSLMNSIKTESNIQLQQMSAETLAVFIKRCSNGNTESKPNPSDKILKNLCVLLSQDASFAPPFAEKKQLTQEILSLSSQRLQTGDDAAMKSEGESQDSPSACIGSRGASATLAAIFRLFGDNVFDALAKLREAMLAPLTTLYGSDLTIGDGTLSQDEQAGQSLLDAMTVIATTVANLSAPAREEVVRILPCLTKALRSRFSVVRYAAARCFAALCDADPVEFVKHVVLDVLPFAADSSNVTNRRGVVEMIGQIVSALEIRILPYMIFFVVPVLGRTTDGDESIRLLATNVFASLVQLIPLETGVPDPVGFPQELLQRREHERLFLSQLTSGGRVEDYRIPITINAELRKYQSEGVSWLAFLAKYQLHGVLCDDMGLGKTLQTICIVASKHAERRERFAATQSPDSTHTPSLVVCPPTLTGHWRHEILTYVGNLQPLLYVDVVITSYDTVRNDIETLNQVDWLYCVLDEGHIIKNSKTRLTQAVKTLRCQHRLILSGTPIQNNVLELWSLFDFLMPGFLGTEKAFKEKFSKPILASRDAKSSSKAQSTGALALEALHKQVLPFLLRRLKEDVLDDLPPKIIQDYYCELSSIQRELYEAFSNREQQGVKSELEEAENATGGHHIFQSLQYLRQLVNDPRLVLKADDSHHRSILERLQSAKGADLDDYPKLQALRQILLDCGIGVPESKDDLGSAAPHRVLVFCQMRQMLDLIENDLFRNHMPTVSYMRLDGSVPPAERHGVVQAFNADPSIDVLLLTTHVGGLGLNLTSADTVVFVEHDWNPMKDLQAMDRAHRLGQKRVVNVYRLITRDTLEEKIMGLQRFKLNIASSVVTQQNASLSSMGTDQVLDLFELSSTKEENDKAALDRPMSQKAILASLDQLADQDQDDLGAAFFAP